MGYDTRNNGQIRTFTPDDTDGRFYIYGSMCNNMASLLDTAREKWGEEIRLQDLNIEADYIHTDCLGYGSYDSSDWTNYLAITLIKREAE